MVGIDGSDGHWLVTAHSLAGSSSLFYWIDGHKAKKVKLGCNPEMVSKCGNAAKYGCNWALLVTYDYVPCGASVPKFSDGALCNQELFYPNIAKCGDLRKAHVTGMDDTMEFTTNTRPDCWNCGAGVYDHCGRLVGIVVNGGKECGNAWTKVLRLHEGMFEAIN